MTFTQARDFMGDLISRTLGANVSVFFHYQKREVTGDFAIYQLSGSQDVNDNNNWDMVHNTDLELYFFDANKIDDYLNMLINNGRVPITSYNVEYSEIKVQGGEPRPVNIIRVAFDGII